MDKNLFDQMFSQVFRPDERLNTLRERLIKYYEATEDIENKSASREWASFKKWCEVHNYTTEEINRAKRQNLTGVRL